MKLFLSRHVQEFFFSSSTVSFSEGFLLLLFVNGKSDKGKIRFFQLSCNRLPETFSLVVYLWLVVMCNFVCTFKLNAWTFYMYSTKHVIMSAMTTDNVVLVAIYSDGNNF